MYGQSKIRANLGFNEFLHNVVLLLVAMVVVVSVHCGMWIKMIFHSTTPTRMPVVSLQVLEISELMVV